MRSRGSRTDSFGGILYPQSQMWRGYLDNSFFTDSSLSGLIVPGVFEGSVSLRVIERLIRSRCFLGRQRHGPAAFHPSFG
jgi:hypothetical protein